jgi:hypothetical protein
MIKYLENGEISSQNIEGNIRKSMQSPPKFDTIK